jgi:hypothetical protein
MARHLNICFNERFLSDFAELFYESINVDYRPMKHTHELTSLQQGLGEMPGSLHRAFHGSQSILLGFESALAHSSPKRIKCR